MFNSDLYPVQLVYLRKPAKANIQGILSIVFQDLIIRRVLNLRLVDIFPTERSKKTQKYFMLEKGVNFVGYEPQHFEKGLLSPFEEIEQIQPKTLTNKILKRFGVPAGYIDAEIMVPLKKEGYISAPPILKSFGMLKATSKGKQIVSELNTYLEEKEQLLTSLIDGDKEQFINAMNEIGALVFIFKKENPELYKNLISMVKRVNISKPLGPENDLTNFKEAMNLDLSFFAH